MKTSSLDFEIGDRLLAICEHTLNSSRHTFGYDVLFDSGRYLGGEVLYDSKGWPDRSHIDPARICPSLMLVKDSGVYLMGSGLPRLLDPDGPVGQSLVSYALGICPHDSGWYERAMAFSADDTVITLDGLPELVLENSGAKLLRISVSEDKVKIQFIF